MRFPKKRMFDKNKRFFKIIVRWSIRRAENWVAQFWQRGSNNSGRCLEFQTQTTIIICPIKLLISTSLGTFLAFLYNMHKNREMRATAYLAVTCRLWMRIIFNIPWVTRIMWWNNTTLKAVFSIVQKLTNREKEAVGRFSQFYYSFSHIDKLILENFRYERIGIIHERRTLDISLMALGAMQVNTLEVRRMGCDTSIQWVHLILFFWITNVFEINHTYICLKKKFTMYLKNNNTGKQLSNWFHAIAFAMSQFMIITSQYTIYVSIFAFISRLCYKIPFKN